RLGIADDGLEEEPVELRLGQRIRALVLHRVLRRDDEERMRQHARLALERDLLLLHRLEQRGLRLGGRAVHLVGEHDVREDRALLDPELAGADLVDARADDVARHEVGRELDALERPADEVRDRARQQGLRGSGDALDEQMAAQRERDERETDRLVLTDDDAMHVARETLRDLTSAHRCVPSSRSICRTLRTNWSSRNRCSRASSRALASAAVAGSLAASVASTRANGVPASS